MSARCGVGIESRGAGVSPASSPAEGCARRAVRPRHRARARAPRPRRDRGVVLVIALVVLVAVVAIVLELAREARIEVNVAARELDEVRVRAVAESGIERALVALATDDTRDDTLADRWRDDETTFRGASIGGGRYWVFFGEPDPGDGRELKYGARDEASKLNVNQATRDQLLKLPGMTEEIADAVLDWRDQDEDARDQGSESSYYNAVSPAYSAKNGPIESLDELLRVKGIDEGVLWGEDRNQNGALDPGEDDGDRSFPPDDANGILGRGLASYLTVYSFDRNTTKDGRARLVVAGASDKDLQDRLVAAGVAPAEVQQIVRWKNRRGAPPVRLVGDLLDAPGVDEAVFAIIWDELASSDAPRIPGRINVNTAAKEVLGGLPGLTDDDLSSIVARRTTPNEDLSTPAWLLRVLPKPKLRAILEQVTTRSDQLTVEVAACLDVRPQVTRRLSVLVDRAFTPPRVLFRRDLSSLGFPLAGERGEGVP